MRVAAGQTAHGQKKPQHVGWGGKPFLLSHIKAPLREEKREVANHLSEIYQNTNAFSSKCVKYLPRPGGSGTILTMTPYASYPLGRPRRLRRDTFTRNLVRENALSTHDLIYPVFVVDGQQQRQPVASMPGVERLSLDLLLPVAQDCVKLGIPVMALFPVIDPALKTNDGREALNADGLVPRVVRELKK